MKLKPKHLEFVLNYLGTKDPVVAYGRTYPNASFKSYSAGASRILARPEVRDYVEFTERRMEDRLLSQIEAEQEAKKQQLLSINEKRAVLTKIITGETKRVRFIKNKYGPQKVEEDLPVYAVLRAVDMDTRLETFYNILIHRQDWNFKQNTTTYINTPTLQQQVNILISQTTEEQKVNVNSPFEGGSLAEAGGCSLAPEITTSVESTSKQILSQSINCPPMTHLALKKETPLLFLGGDIGEAPPAREPIGEVDSRNTLAQKNTLKLTKVNKTENPIYNTTTKSTTKPPEGNQEKSPPRRRKGGTFPLVTPHPSIDYNPYTLEPLDPNIDYSYKSSENNEKAPSPWERAGGETPIPGKITVKPTMREYD